MDKTEVDDPSRLLSKLSKQERNVLELRCEGLDYKAIGKELSLSGRTVKQYMKNIYIKLDLDHLPRTEKESKILIIYYPLIHTLGVLPETENEKIPSEPIPKNGNGMVDEDENIHAGDLEKGEKSLTPHENQKGGSGLKLVGFLLVGVLLGMCIIAAVFVLVIRPVMGTIPFFIQPTSIVHLPTPIITETKVQTSTIEPMLTTPVTILADTVTPSPTAAPTSTITFTPSPTIIPTDILVPTNTDTLTPTPDYYMQGETYEIQPGVFLVLQTDFGVSSYVGCSNFDGYNIVIDVQNQSAAQYILRFKWTDFTVVDNNGKNYPVVSAGIDNCHSQPGVMAKTIDAGYNDDIEIAIPGPFDLNTQYLTITALNISGIGPIKFRKKI